MTIILSLALSLRVRVRVCVGPLLHDAHSMQSQFDSDPVVIHEVVHGGTADRSCSCASKKHTCTCCRTATESREERDATEASEATKKWHKIIPLFSSPFREF